MAIHELGHIVVAESQDINYEYNGVTIIYPDADFTESEQLSIASAGFQAQWIASEIALRKLDESLNPGTRRYGLFWSVENCKSLNFITPYTLLGHRMGRKVMVEQFLPACQHNLKPAIQ